MVGLLLTLSADTFPFPTYMCRNGNAGRFPSASTADLVTEIKGGRATEDRLERLHREKAGTIEHVHRSMKDELGAGVMPSGKFGLNAAWFRINALTFNVLTVLKRHALPARYKLARPKRLRFEL